MSWERGPSPICVEMLISLILCRSWEGNHSCCEFTRAGNEGSTLVLSRRHCFSSVFQDLGLLQYFHPEGMGYSCLTLAEQVTVKLLHRKEQCTQFGVGAYPAWGAKLLPETIGCHIKKLVKK